MGCMFALKLARDPAISFLEILCFSGAKSLNILVSKTMTYGCCSFPG